MIKKIVPLAIVLILLLVPIASTASVTPSQPVGDLFGSRPTATLAPPQDVSTKSNPPIVFGGDIYGAKPEAGIKPTLNPSFSGVSPSQASNNDLHGARPAIGLNGTPSSEAPGSGTQARSGIDAEAINELTPDVVNQMPSFENLPANAGDCPLIEGFDTVVPSGWVTNNLSSPVGVNNWFQGKTVVFAAHSGAANSYAGANLLSTAGAGTISDWLISPMMTFINGDEITFYTRTETGSTWPDRVQARLSIAGPSTNVGSDQNSVGDFTTLLVDINPTLAVHGYPETWTEFRLIVSGLTMPTTGRFAFRYFVTDGGSSGTNSDYIGVDTFSVCRKPPPPVCPLIEGFNTVVPSGWIMNNLSNPAGSTNWYQGNASVFPAHSGASTSYAAANFNSTSGAGTISDWLISPMMTFINGDKIIFYTRTATGSSRPDRLQGWLSTGRGKHERRFG